MVSKASLKNNFQQNDSYETYQYFYHPDHLGSSSFITNIEGEVVQHIEYVPYGEVFIEERNNVWNTPYLFNAKEFDEETGLYYYGARYYEPTLTLWYGVDALAEKYPSIGGYVYCVGNPVRLVDVDANDWYEAEDGTMQYTNKHYENQKDFDKNSGLKGVWRGYTTEIDGTYYGLFGKEVSNKEYSVENVLMYRLIDKSIIDYNTPEEIDYSVSEPPTERRTDFSKIALLSSKDNKSKSIVHTPKKEFEYNGAKIIVNMVGANTKLSFNGIKNIDALTTADYSGNKAFRMNLVNSNGLPIVEIIYNNISNKDAFTQKYKSLFPK